MNPTELLSQLRSKVSSEIDIESEGLGRYIVYTPFMFDDGDHYVVILRKHGDEWMLSDEGHTLMHLSYSGLDLATGTRARIIEEAITANGVELLGGELSLRVPHDDFGNALFSFVQALIRTSTVAQVTRERVASAFFDDFKELMSEIVPSERLDFDWHDRRHDPDGNYMIDCKINGAAPPWFVFAINSTDRCRNASITCLMYERWGFSFGSLVIFENQQEVNRKALAQMSDIVGKQFSSLGDRERITQYFRQNVLSKANP